MSAGTDSKSLAQLVAEAGGQMRTGPSGTTADGEAVLKPHALCNLVAAVVEQSTAKEQRDTLLAIVQEAVRIEQARLVLVDGMNPDGSLYTEAQKLDARAFLSNRRASWLHEAIAAITQAAA